MRSVGCGFLLLGFWVFPALGQAPNPAPWPSLDGARCDGTRWEKTIADIKAADPERDAEVQIAQGKYALRSARVLIETFIASPGLAQLDITPDAVHRERLPGVRCHLDMRPTEAFPIQGYTEDATTGILDRWCVRAALVLAGHYAKRFNGRIVRDPDYPHRDLCTEVRSDSDRSAKIATIGIAAQPTPDLVPAQIPDVATAARFGLADRVAKFITDGADLSQRDLFGFDAIKWSVVRDYPAIFDLLVAAGGAPDFCGALEAAVAHHRGAFVVPLAGRCASRAKRWALLTPTIRSGGNLQAVRALMGIEPVSSLTEWPSLTEALSAAVSKDRADLVRVLMAGVAPESRNAGEELKGLRQSLLRSALAGRRGALRSCSWGRAWSPARTPCISRSNGRRRTSWGS